MKEATMLSSAVGIDVDQEDTIIVCATLIGIDNSGAPVIESNGVRRKSRFLAHLTDSIRKASDHLPVQVLVSFVENEDSPILMGIVRSDVNRELSEVRPNENLVTVDGQRIEFTAQTEVELKCGRSSIRLTKDGKVIVKGVDITSRASRKNKIKGASVNIN